MTPTTVQPTTLTAETRATVARATVKLTGSGGRGVLVPGGFIVTAAHCVKFATDGGMVLGDHYVEEIETQAGPLRVAPLAVEPLSDVAVLGALDSQEFARDVERFEWFCESTTPVPLCLSDFEPLLPFPVYVYTHTGEWVRGTGKQCQPNAASLAVEFEQQIEGGSSGSPIVNESGELVAVVSNASETGQACDGIAPRPHLAMPVWIARLAAGKRDDF